MEDQREVHRLVLLTCHYVCKPSLLEDAAQLLQIGADEGKESNWVAARVDDNKPVKKILENTISEKIKKLYPELCFSFI